MVNLLFSILQPILGPMGVSDADLTGYIELCQGYVWGILAALVVMIVVIVLATKAKKPLRGLIQWTSVVAWIAVVAIIANMVCYGPLKSVIDMQLSGGGDSVALSEETIAASKDVVQKVGEEGLVLVKNNGLLPLSSDTKKLNVFGWDSTNPLFGGTGSGSSDGASSTGILASLQMAGYETNEELTKMYTDYRADRPSIAMSSQDWTLPEPTIDYYTDSLMSNAKDFSDVAVIVIGRSGGEGADLPTDMYAVIHGTWNIAGEMATASYGYTNGVYTNNGSYDDFDEGETYLELSNTEEAMIEKVCSEFSNVIVIINANNTMELSWVDEYDSIGAVILAPGAGNTGFVGLGEIINGTVNPSGRTVDTFVKDLTDTPTWNNAGNFSYTNVSDLRDALTGDSAYEGNIAFVNYVEGIYVGYKYYETAYAELQAAAAEAAAAEADKDADKDEAAEEAAVVDADEWYASTVQYPFGYGLSYTTFEQSIESFDASGDTVKMTVKVTNTGSVAGKDVVEVYLTAPYTNGGIEKSAATLIDFGKTSSLAAGASETLTFEIAKEDFASYDDSGIKIAGGGYILEAGDYTISVRADSHTVLDSETWTEAADIDYSTGRSSDKTAATNQFDDYARGDFVQLSRADHFANYDEATAAPAASAYEMSDETKAVITAETSIYYDGSLYDDASDTMPTTGASNGLTVSQLRGTDYNDAKWDQLIQQMSIDEMVSLINNGGWMTQKIDSIGLVSTNNCDGPAGLNNFITGAQGTAFPSEVMMAQTWNTELIEEMSEAMGQEYVDANNYGIYGPAMNTHRTAFAGRNFEYYSEDGILAAKMAVAQVKGQQSKGCYSYIKHFALNDQETNRCTFVLTYASEQAIREIYLKPFEAAVKQADAHAVMSSFNFIGTKPSCANSNLLENVLRDEWGFQGFVCTDYDGSYGYMVADNIIRNGGDLHLGFGNASNPARPNALPHNASADDTTASATLVKEMQRACKNIVYTIANSGYYATATDEASADPLGDMFKVINGSVIGVCVVIEALAVVYFVMKSRKK